MKILTSTFLALLLLAVAACDPNGERFQSFKNGHVSFSAKNAPREVIRLKNAKTQQTKATAAQRSFLNVYKGDVQVITDADIDSVGTAELEVGEYRATLEYQDEEGRVYGEAAETFTVTAGENIIVNFAVYSKAASINIALENLPEAVVWYGPADFAPDDSFLYPEFAVSIYPEDYHDILDIVVEFQGERKRYSTDLLANSDYYITIVRNDGEEPDPEEPVASEDVTFNWELVDNAPTVVEYEW